ncbi:hypothetical protein KO317_01440 [Candidatus Micrarchaeota archaeon]|nr:hypothetical protein [Candidatus Micrarchaeota archaeon]
MDNKKIILLALSIAVLSIVLLFIFINTTIATQISLYSTPTNKIPRDTLIEFQGTIEKITFNEKTVSLRICDGNCLTVICQNDLEILKILSEKDFVKVIGVTKSYYQGITVYANEITYP